jgi:hypothetical protein
MDDTDRRLVVFEERIKELESAVDQIADQVLSLEGILTELAEHLLPKEDLEEDDQ